MKKIFLILIIIVCSLKLSFAEKTVVTNKEQYEIKDKSASIKEVAEYLKERESKLKEAKSKKEPESALRRFEVQFFSAGAMSYLTTWLATRLFALATISSGSDLPDIYWMFVVTNSVGMATYIATKDYYDVKRIKSKEIDRMGYKEQNYYKISLINQQF